LRYFPALLLVAIGLAPANTRAIAQAVFSHHHTFVRTPKGPFKTWPNSRSAMPAARPYRLPFDWIVIVELVLALYSAVGVALCIMNGNIGPLFFMLSCAIGLGYVALSTFSEQF
jgi:hypothetical protein